VWKVVLLLANQQQQQQQDVLAKILLKKGLQKGLKIDISFFILVTIEYSIGQISIILIRPLLL
jgi:hypothetical protein